MSSPSTPLKDEMEVDAASTRSFESTTSESAGSPDASASSSATSLSLSPAQAEASTLSSASAADQPNGEAKDAPSSSAVEEAEKAASALSLDDRQAKAQELKAEGNKLFVSGQYDLAKAKYGEALAYDDKIAAIWGNKAACELKLEQHGLVIEDATKAIELDPNFSKAYWRRASAHLSILDPKAALPDLKKCAALEPRNASVRQSLDATVKLIRRLAFETAIRKEEGKSAAATVLEHLIEGSGGTQVPDSYDGPRIEEVKEANASEEDKALGHVTKDFVEGMIKRFKEEGKLPLRYAWQIILGAKKAMDQEKSLVDYEIPTGTTIDVVGDTHGQFYDFLHLLSLTGPPSETHAVLFNGDFVDRGSWSVEIALTIFAYKCLYPRTTLINRGNHETSDMNKVYGFEGECKHKYGPSPLTFQLFSEAFVSLPLATLITAPKEPVAAQDLPAMVSKAQKSPILSKAQEADGSAGREGRKRFFVVHGGLFSKDGVTLADIRAIDRRKQGQPGQEGLMMELLWSDPQAARGRGPSKRGVGLGFGPDITRQWCEFNGVTAVLRSHEVRQGGFAEEHDGLCCTIFSAPNYCDSVGNKGAFARIDEQGTMKFEVFEAQPHPNVKPMAYAGSGMGGMLGM